MAAPGRPREPRYPHVYDKIHPRETNPAMRPVALQPYNNWDKAHDYEKDGGMDHVTMLKISYADYSKRPAKQQVPMEHTKNVAYTEGCNEYNIWYDRHIGEQWQQRKELIAAETRCNVRRDAGRTKADVYHGEHGYFCIFFARGCCSNGSDCSFLHRVPKPEDDARLAPIKDCFGRDRHATDKDDMRGTGNFNRMNKTLYVGGIKMLRGPEATHKTILRHFSEWGHIDQLRLIPKKAIAFVTYTHRACAEFALEAMHCQTLDSDDLLNVRWAYDDPNPKAIQLEKEKLHDIFMEGMAKAGVTHIPGAEYEYPTDYEAPANKRMRVAGPDGASSVVSAYPDTDAQFDESGYEYLYEGGAFQQVQENGASAGVGASGAVGGIGVQSREEAEREEMQRKAREEREEAMRRVQEAEKRLAAVLDNVDRCNADTSAHCSIKAAGPAKPAAAGTGRRRWKRAHDGESGRDYFYCAENGDTVWELPKGGLLEEDAVQGAPIVSAEEYAAQCGISVAEARGWLEKWVQGQQTASPEGEQQGGDSKDGGDGEARVEEDDDFAALMDEAKQGAGEGEGEEGKS